MKRSNPIASLLIYVFVDLSSNFVYGFSIRSRSISTPPETLKKELLHRIDLLRSIQTFNGDVSVDYGVKGGELDAKTRTPQKVSFYQISDAAGMVADDILNICEQLSAYNPTEEATRSWGTSFAESECPLHGPWKLLFSTAADATFSKNSKRGNASVQNFVDGVNGRMSNIINFIPASKQDNKPSFVQQLKVQIKASALSNKRVGLEFRYAKITFGRFLFFPVKWSLYIPVPATFLTRLVVLASRIFRQGSSVRPPKAFFDIMYLDDEIRIHKTGEDNVFVQGRPDWAAASGLFQPA